MKNAIVLFSGGLDSTTCLAIAKSQGFQCYALSFNYGQKHQIELAYAIKGAKKWQVVDHKIISLPIDQLVSSSLTDPKLSIPDFQISNEARNVNDVPSSNEVRNANQVASKNEVPSTYVPARNTIFLSFALAFGETVQAYDIFIGANEVDYSGYPDCRPDYLQAFEKMAVLGTKAGAEGVQFKIHAPLLRMNKAQIIREGLRLGVDYRETLSCYRANELGEACGTCDSCMYRKKGFAEAFVSDPTIYKDTFID